MQNVRAQCTLPITLGCVPNSGVLVLDRPICEEIRIWAHCRCRNCLTHIETLLYFVDQSRFLMYSSVPRSLYLDQYLAVIDCSSNHCGPRSVWISSINAWLLDQCSNFLVTCLLLIYQWPSCMYLGNSNIAWVSFTKFADVISDHGNE